MECLLIPGIIGFVLLAVWGIKKVLCRRHPCRDYDLLDIPCVVLVVLLFSAVICCSAVYLDGRSDVLALEAYYTYVVQPNTVEETGDYVVVDNYQAGLWQAGEINLSGYNSMLRQLRYWDSIPIVGSAVFHPPDYLKYVMVR